MTVNADEVQEAIKKAEQLLGRYRYDNRPLSNPRQKGLATAENLLIEARLKVSPKRVDCKHCNGTGKVNQW